MSKSQVRCVSFVYSINYGIISQGTQIILPQTLGMWPVLCKHIFQSLSLHSNSRGWSRHCSRVLGHARGCPGGWLTSGMRTERWMLTTTCQCLQMTNDGDASSHGGHVVLFTSASCLFTSGNFHKMAAPIPNWQRNIWGKIKSLCGSFCWLKGQVIMRVSYRCTCLTVVISILFGDDKRDLNSCSSNGNAVILVHKQGYQVRAHGFGQGIR